MTAREFGGLVQAVRSSGDGFTARCPGHKDQRASLTFRDGDHGLLVKCHAGCSVEAIAGALGLRVADLFARGGGDASRPAEARIIAAYPYHDEARMLLYEVIRFAPKDFRQRRPNAGGGWVWNLNGVRRVLYRLPDLKARATVYVVEGEKDSDRVATLGIPATTNPCGAGKWTDDYAAQLKAAGVKRVVILPDNDSAGESHALAVARSCLAAALTLKIVRLPGLSAKGDVSDWLDAGHTQEELAALVKATPTADSRTLPEATSPAALPLTSLGDLLSEPPEECAWLVENRLPVGGLSLVAGKPKSGKSTLARCLALAVARGEPWLGWATRQGPVFYLALEEKRAEVRKHFASMGATRDDPVFVFIAPSPQDGLAQLREAAHRMRPVLIVVDPLLKLVRVRDANDYAAISNALEPLPTLARELGAHILTVHHTGKGERTGGDANLGSTAIFAAVDTALLLKRTERYRTLSSIQRYGEDLEEVIVTLDPDTRTVSVGVPRKEADEADAEQVILAYLREASEPAEEAVILEAVEGRRAVKERALRRLVGVGRVTRTGGGKRGDPYRYSVSPSLPPTYIWEGEKRNGKTHVTHDEQAIVSPSHENAPSGTSGECREGETEALAEVQW